MATKTVQIADASAGGVQMGCLEGGLVLDSYTSGSNLIVLYVPSTCLQQIGFVNLPSGSITLTDKTYTYDGNSGITDVE